MIYHKNRKNKNHFYKNAQKHKNKTVLSIYGLIKKIIKIYESIKVKIQLIKI